MRKLMYEQYRSSGRLTRQSSAILSPDSLAPSQHSVPQRKDEFAFPKSAFIQVSIWRLWEQRFYSQRGLVSEFRVSLHTVLVLRKWIIILLQHFWTWCSLYWFLDRAVMMWFRKDLDQNWNTTLPYGWLHYRCILQLWPPSKLRKSPSNI